MVARTTIRVTAETELSSLLDEVAKGPLLLERDGELFRLAVGRRHRLRAGRGARAPHPG